MDWDSGTLGNSPKTSTEWKNKGNNEFLVQKYEKALQSYTEGLKFTDCAGGDTTAQVMSDILANRATVYLKLDCFQSALDDLEKLLGFDPTHFKGLYRKGKALLGLQRFQEAIEFLKRSSNLSNLASENQKLWMELLELAQNCLIQQKTGEYDILKLYKAGEVRHNDCADFMGPVKVQEISGNRNGRGLVATQNIQPGQLISATKAFEIVFPEQEKGPSPWVAVFAKPGIKVHVVSHHHPPNFHLKLVQKIVQKLTREPILCRTFYQLYAGPDFPIFDLEKDPLVVDERRIEAICLYNEFVGNMPNFGELCKSPHALEKSIGIWILPSFINHRCLDVNATWLTFGDMLFVRALKEIPIGSEILISYVDPTQMYEERDKILKARGFVCDCSLCLIDRDDSKEGKKRMKFLKKIQKNPCECDCLPYHLEMEMMMKKLWDLDKDGQNPNLKLNPSLTFPLIRSILFHNDSVNYKKALDLVLKRHALTTNSALEYNAVECCFLSISLNLKSGKLEEAKKWMEALKKEMKIFFGTYDLAHLMSKKTLELMEEFNIFLK